MTSKKFKQLVQEELQGLSYQNTIYFAWLCAVRVLPLLGAKGNFCYWSKECQRYLFTVLRALDVSISYNNNVANAAYNDTVAAANAIVYGDTTNSTNAAINAAYAAASAAHAAENAANAANAAYDAAAYAVNASAANAAYDDVAIVGRYSIDLRPTLLNDLSLIRTGHMRGFQHDTSIYGPIWSNFQKALKDADCEYWFKLYEYLFAKDFVMDDADRTALERRINVPAGVRENGAAAVAVYLENAEKQGVVYIQRETRLIILGSAGAGKTTLVRRLSGDTSYPDIQDDSTHGVDTSVKLDFDGIKTHVWDFGGQVIYHASHRCFLSENCVYILVVNARTEDNRDINRINYWLDTIRVYSENKAKVFIIINESDNRMQNVEDYDSFKHSEYKSLIQEIYSFNVGKDMNSLNEFKKELAAYIETNGHQTFGRNDNDAIEEIKTLFDQKIQIVKAAELEEILSNNGIQTSKDQKRAKELFNVLGVALSYDFLESHVLDPYWISHGVFKVIDHLQKNKSKFINYNELDVVFVDERDTYPKDKYNYVLQLMEHYKIGFRNRDGVHGLIVPCAASQFKPRDVIVDVEPDSYVTQVERDELQEFPADFFYRYICANEDDINKNDQMWAMWQTGMVLAKEYASALVELIENRRIKITVWGERKEDYSKKLESLIDNLLKEYRFTSYEEERNKGGKLVKIITLVFESMAKGVTKALIENASGNAIKP